MMIYKVGDKVQYKPFPECTEVQILNGIVKELPLHTDKEIRVVFYCNDDWNNFMDYTSQLTPIDHLEFGWKTIITF